MLTWVFQGLTLARMAPRKMRPHGTGVDGLQRPGIAIGLCGCMLVQISQVAATWRGHRPLLQS